MKKVKIELNVQLGDDNIPEKIEWVSDDGPSKGELQGAKGFLLSLFDEKSLETMKIDLWTKKMEIGEMNRLCYYTFKGMAESFHNATKNADLANDMARFAQYFGEQSGVIKALPTDNQV
jgi:gliding motility-associated protein GldC